MIHSFQFQIIFYSLISMLLTAVTILILALAVYGIYVVLRSEAKEQEKQNSWMQSNYGNLPYYPEVTKAAALDDSLPAPRQEVEGDINSSTQNGMLVVPTIAESGSLKRPEGRTENEGRIQLEDGAAGFLIVVGLLLALFFFVFYFLILTRKLTAYLEEIIRGTERLAAGEFGTKIEVRQSNELTKMAVSLNAMADDIERMMNEERKNETARTEMIASIAHDLRTPLTSVIGYMELVAEMNLDADKRAHYVSVAYRKAKRMQKLLEDLFSYVQYGSKEVPMELARIDAVKMMEQLLEEMYPNIQESRLELEVEKKTDSAMVDADGLLLARAFSNLLGNAIKYGRDGKNMKVQMERGEGQVILRVINFGEVIPKKDLENIFLRFYRVDSARTEAQGGAGLGLAIAKNIIELHHGTIGVKSDLDGTEFCVCLPLAKA